jgi:proteasome assembly chaperone 2
MISRAPIYHLPVPCSAPAANTPISTLDSLPIPLFQAGPTPSSLQDNSSVPFIPGGGLTRRILNSISLSHAFPASVVLLHFVMEGDNREDAKLLATAVARVLGDAVMAQLPKEGWKEPSSWRQGLFGTNHDSTLYG